MKKINPYYPFNFNNYLKVMVNINERFNFINAILENEDENDDKEFIHLLYENCATQLRIIIELITTAIFIANEHSMDFNKMKSDWSATAIIKKIRKKNNLCLPIPLHVNHELTNVSAYPKIFIDNIDLAKKRINLDNDILKIYENLQKYCHAGTLKNVLSNTKTNTDIENIQQYIRQIFAIISSHILLTGNKRNLACIFNNQSVTVHSIDIDNIISTNEKIVFNKIEQITSPSP